MTRLNFIIFALLMALSGHARIYLCGDGIGWDKSEPAVLEPVGGQYTFNISNGSSFMVSTATGGELLFDANGYGAVIGTRDAGRTLPLVPMHEPTVLPWHGDWTVSISSDLKSIVVTTDTPQPMEFARLYIRGDVNGWQAEDTWQFVTADGKTYWFDAAGETAITGGTSFKIADDGWREYILGPAGNSVITADGESRRWVEYGNDATVSTDYRGTIRVDLADDGSKDAFVTFYPELIQHAGIPTIGLTDGTAAHYYDLLGRPTARPESGKIYIVRQGAKISKTYIP